MNYRNAMFPGTFDPPTYGHLDVIERASKLYDKVFVVISKNLNKNELFSVNERLSMLKELTSKFKNVEVVIWENLLVNFAKEHEIGVIIRGLRSSEDFSYEFEIAQINQNLLPGLEVLFMPTDPKYLLVRSSYVKELSNFGAKIDSMVPELVAKLICSKQKC